MDVLIMVAEKAYLKIVNKSAYLSVIKQQTGNGDERDAVIRNSFRRP
jgi:hypothetical protein